MIKLVTGLSCVLIVGMAHAQVGINTETPQNALDVNGSIQIRKELQINGNPGEPGEIYFSKGNISEPDWEKVKVSFLEEGQYQLVNTFAISDDKGIDWVGAQASIAVFYETFENDSPSKSKWTNEAVVNGSPDWNLSATGSTANVNTAHSGSYNASFRSATNNHRTRLVSPVFDFSGYSSNLSLSFWYAKPAQGMGTTNLNYLGIWYRKSDDGVTWTSWTQIGTNYTANITSWTQVSNVTLTNSANAAYYQIAFDGLQRGTGHAIVLDDIEIKSTIASSGYQSALSPIGELITAKNWIRIPGLDLPIKINEANNRISVIFQTGVESRMNAGGAGNQVEGNIRFTCGLFRRKASEPLNTSTLVAIRGDQINNTINKPIANKTQTVYTLTYTINDTPADNYVFSIACRRLSLTAGGGAENSSLLSIGNSVNSGNAVTNDFMLNSILKLDLIELVTISVESEL